MLSLHGSVLRRHGRNPGSSGTKLRPHSGTPTASSGSSASSPARKHPGAAPASHTGPCSRSPGFRSAGNSPPLPPVPARVPLVHCFAAALRGTLLFLYTPGPCWSSFDLMAPLFDQEPDLCVNQHVCTHRVSPRTMWLDGFVFVRICRFWLENEQSTVVFLKFRADRTLGWA